MSAEKLKGHLWLKNIYKGSNRKAHKVKKLEHQWFSSNQGNNKKAGTSVRDDLNSDMYVDRESLVQNGCK